MTVKVGLFAGVFLLAQSPAGEVRQAPYHYPAVHQVICKMEKGSTRGTAFLVAPNTLATAAHVLDEDCSIDGKPITVKENRGDLDFAIVEADIPGRPMRVNCAGFTAGRWAYATGYANGFGWQTTLALLAVYLKDEEGKRALLGMPRVIPGMSGGPIVNEAGEVLGIVNAYHNFAPLSFSRELKDTSLCRSA
jgi:hypothetical protein